MWKARGSIPRISRLFEPFQISTESFWIILKPSKTPEAEELFLKVSEIFVNWAKSINFRREEQNYVVQNNIDNMAVITSDIVAHKVSDTTYGLIFILFYTSFIGNKNSVLCQIILVKSGRPLPGS